MGEEQLRELPRPTVVAEQPQVGVLVEVLPFCGVNGGVPESSHALGVAGVDGGGHRGK